MDKQPALSDDVHENRAPCEVVQKRAEPGPEYACKGRDDRRVKRQEEIAPVLAGRRH